MKLKSHDEEAGRLVLELGDSARVSGGLMTAAGGMAASFALKMLRLPVPLPFKLIPLGVLGVGAGVGAMGAFTAFADYTITVERGVGVTFRWKWGPRDPQELHVTPEEIEDFEIVRASHTRGVGVGPGTDEVVTHRLMLITKKGAAYGLDELATETQAKLRRRMIRRALKER
jgi:hypothetical protein